MSVDFEIDNFISLKSTQTIRWQIEYPATGLQAEVLSHIYISQRDIRGIVPLAEVRLVKCALIVGAHLATWCNTVEHSLSHTCSMEVLYCSVSYVF